MLSQTPTELLDKFLRWELAAARTHDAAVRLADEVRSRETLRRCRASHAARAKLLERHIEARGFTPSETPGAWGVLTVSAATAAAAFGDGALLGLIELGEEGELERYETETLALDLEGQRVLRGILLREQQRTTTMVRSARREHRRLLS